MRRNKNKEKKLTRLKTRCMSCQKEFVTKKDCDKCKIGYFTCLGQETPTCLENTYFCSPTCQKNFSSFEHQMVRRYQLERGASHLYKALASLTEACRVFKHHDEKAFCAMAQRLYDAHVFLRDELMKVIYNK